MARLSKLLGSKHLTKRVDEAREHFAGHHARDPQAWAYMACEQDADTCETCLHAAGLLREAKLTDPRLVVMFRGHPDCTSPQGCRCRIVVVAGDDTGGGLPPAA